jgi:hypothetical protein
LGPQAWCPRQESNLHLRLRRVMSTKKSKQAYE